MQVCKGLHFLVPNNSEETFGGNQVFNWIHDPLYEDHKPMHFLQNEFNHIEHNGNIYYTKTLNSADLPNLNLQFIHAYELML